MSNSQDNFSKQIKLIKDAGDEKALQAEACIKEAKQVYLEAQKTMTREFDALNQNYTNVMEAFSYLSTDVHAAQTKQDKCHLKMMQTIGFMMQILVRIHQNLANGTNPDPLLQEQVNSIMQCTLDEDNGNGAPGMTNTKSSLTTQQEGGQRNKMSAEDFSVGVPTNEPHRLSNLHPPPQDTPMNTNLPPPSYMHS
jgi:hypothetical protein